MKNHKIALIIINILRNRLFASRYMFWHPNNMIGYMFMAYNAPKYKMAAKMAAVNEKNDEIAIAYFFCI